MAKDLVRTRRYVRKFMLMKANIQAVSLKIQTLKSQSTMAQAMKGVTKAMATMNRQLNMPQIQKILQVRTLTFCTCTFYEGHHWSGQRAAAVRPCEYVSDSTTAWPLLPSDGQNLTQHSTASSYHLKMMPSLLFQYLICYVCMIDSDDDATAPFLILSI